MRIVRPGDGDYINSRKISNARFNTLEPNPICFCSTDDDIREAIGMTGVRGVRLRSGRHHHEGMCSGENVLVLDVSPMNGMIMADLGATLTVGPGAKLRDIYSRMSESKRILPGGGCGDVCIGGLVQGAGWGLYSREHGLTCDRLVQFTIVKADGSCATVRRPAAGERNLFWAVAGGGGGNFGVVTEFVFELGMRPDTVWTVEITWDDASLIEEVVTEWCERFPDSDTKLTTFCRVTAAGKKKPAKPTDPPVLISGTYLGSTKEQIEQLLAKLLPKTLGKRSSLSIEPQPPTAHVPHYQPGPPAEAIRAFRAATGEELAGEEPENLADTCGKDPYPHKVSSCFPRGGFGKDAIAFLAKYVRDSDSEETARRYLSLHCLGGNIRDKAAKERSSFFWRDKPFILQYQAWWTDPREESPVTKRCMAWVTAFRNGMSGHTEGSFINFPDRSLPVKETDPAKALKELLRYYYSDNLEDLIRIKREVDRLNQFWFEMGIPTA
jgi:hypothetical protein